MKALIIAMLSTGIVTTHAFAGTASDTKIKRHHHHVTADGYYTPGVPKRDPGRYSNLPGKYEQQSKAFIKDH